jgi:hypothetical protein
MKVAFEDRDVQRIEEVLERGPPSPQQVVRAERAENYLPCRKQDDPW